MPVSIKALAKTLADRRPKRFENDWKEFIKRPQDLAEECQNVIAEKANAEDLGELLAELQKEDAKELIDRFYRKYEKAEDHPVDHVALVDRLRRLIQLTELSARLMHAQNATSFSPLLAELEQLFQPIVDPDDQIGWPDVDGGGSPLGAVDKWIRRGIQQTQDTDAKNQYASDRAILAFLHPHLRTVRQTLTVSGLYYYEQEDGAEKGCVVKLTAKAFGEGTGSIYPDPETMTLAPLAETKGKQFTEQVESAWDLAKKRTGKCSDLEIDIQWSVNLDDLPDESPKHRFKLPYPIAGNSWNASWTTVFECLLAGDDVDLGWALTAAVDECGKLKSVAGVAAKSKAWFEKGRERQEDYRLLVNKEDLREAKQEAGQASSCVRQVGTLDDVKQELEELRRDLYGPVKFQRPPVPPDFTGREDAIERLTAILNSEESRYVVVGGERGMGKSALLAKMIEDAYNEGKRPVFHVAGHDRVGLQESLVAKLKRKHLHDIRFHQKKSLSDVLDVVQKFLEREDRTEILYLDESNADDMLPVTQDLPRKLPSRFRCLIMTRDADKYEQHLRESEYAPYQLEELLDDGGRRDVREYLLRHAKDFLRADVIDAIGRHRKTVANFKTIKWCLKQLKNENKFSEHLRDSPDMWLRKLITSSILPSVATDFLTELSDKGLCNNVQFLPEHIETGCDIEKFCLPPRVVDAEQWEQQRKRASEQGRPGFHQRSEADDRYVMMSHEEFLRGDGEDRVVPLPLSAPNDDDWQVLEGEPGEGKTTALWLMIAQQCHGLLDRQQRGEPITEASGHRIPLVLPLRTVDSEQRSKRLVELAREYVLSQMGSLETEKRGQLRQWLDQKIQDREYTLYLDAWDELPGGEAGRSWLKEQLLDCRGVPLLLTTRTSLSHEARGLTPEPRRYRMVCFGNRQIREYVEQFFKKQPEQGRELRERSRLSPGPSQLMQLPLLLGLMCMQKRKHPDEPLPQTRTELLQRGLYELFERGDNRRKIEDPRKERNWQKERVLRYVAWRFHKAEPVELSNSLRDREQNLDNVLKEKIEWLEEDPPKNAQALLTEFVEDGVLVPVGRDTYRFVLRSFHEYCLAGWIAQEKDSPLFRAKDEPTFQRVLQGTGADWERTDWDDFTPLVEENWQHVWPLVAGQMLERGDWILREVQRGFLEYGDYGKFPPESPATIASELSADSPARRLFVEDLICWMADGFDRLRDWSIESLASIADESCRDALICRLNADEPDVEDERDGFGRDDVDLANIASALGQIGDPQSRDALVRFLRNSSTWTAPANAAVEALGHIGDEDARNTLVSMLHDPTYTRDQRCQCAKALRQVACQSSIRGLFQTLDDPRTHPELWATSALAIIASSDGRELDQVIERLIKVPSTNAIIVHELAVVGQNVWASYFAPDLLIHCLENPAASKRLQAKCAETLTSFYADRAVIQSLLNCITSAEMPIEVRQQCVNSLGDMAWLIPKHVNDSIVDHMIKLLDNANIVPELRWRCATKLLEYPMKWQEQQHFGYSSRERDLSHVFIDRLLDPTMPPAVRACCAERVYLEWCAPFSCLDNDARQKGRDILIRVLRDEDAPEEIRSACATQIGEYLREFHDDASRNALMSIRDDPRSSPDLQIHVWDLLNDQDEW